MNSQRPIRAQVQPGDRIRILPARSLPRRADVLREVLTTVLIAGLGTGVAGLVIAAAVWWACK